MLSKPYCAPFVIYRSNSATSRSSAKCSDTNVGLKYLNAQLLSSCSQSTAEPMNNFICKSTLTPGSSAVNAVVSMCISVPESKDDAQLPHYPAVG